MTTCERNIKEIINDNYEDSQLLILTRSNENLSETLNFNIQHILELFYLLRTHSTKSFPVPLAVHLENQEIEIVLSRWLTKRLSNATRVACFYGSDQLKLTDMSII